MSLINIFENLRAEIRIGNDARDMLVQHVDKAAAVMAEAHRTQADALAELRSVIIQHADERNAALMKELGEPVGSTVFKEAAE